MVLRAAQRGTAGPGGGGAGRPGPGTGGAGGFRRAASAAARTRGPAATGGGLRPGDEPRRPDPSAPNPYPCSCMQGCWIVLYRGDFMSGRGVL